MKNDMQDLRYRIGDLMGDYAPESFRRKSSSSEWIIGLGSIAAAVGISYLAMRMADRRLGDVMRRIVPSSTEREFRDRRAFQGTDGDRVPEAASSSMFKPRQSEARARSGGADRTERTGQASGNRH